MIVGGVPLLLKKKADALPSDYVGYYRGDTISGSTLTDLSGNGYNGTINGATQSGEYLSFDGANDSATLNGLFSAISADQQGTVVIAGKFPTGGRLYLGIGDNNASNFLQFIIIETAALYAFKTGGAAAGVNNFTVRRNDTYLTETDYVITFVQDATDGVLIYLNGAELTINQTTGTPGDKWIGDAADMDTMNLWRLDYDNTDLFYAGDMKYLAYYDRRLTATEIAGIEA